MTDHHPPMTEPITDTELDALLAGIAAREQAATVGPWKWGPADPDKLDDVPTGDDDALWAGSHRVLTDGSARGEYSPDIDVLGDDAKFIAHAREDIPDLLALIAQLRSDLTLSKFQHFASQEALRLTEVESDSLRTRLQQVESERNGARADDVYARTELEKLRGLRDKWLTLLNPATGYETMEDAIQQLHTAKQQAEHERDGLQAQLREAMDVIATADDRRLGELAVAQRERDRLKEDLRILTKGRIIQS